MRLSLISDASKPYFRCVRGFMTPKQQAADSESTAFGDSFCLEAPVVRALFSMNYFYKSMLQDGS